MPGMKFAEEELTAFTDAPSEDQSRRLSELGRELAEVSARMEQLQRDYDEAKERRAEIQTRELPEYMLAIGQDRIGLPDYDVDVVLEPFYHANIAADWMPEDREAAFQYLIERGDGGLIKTVLSYAFGREQIDDARWVQSVVRLLAGQLAEAGIEVGTIPEPDVRTAVHAQTLTAWLREQIQAGNEVDLKVLRATVGRIAKLKKRR